MSNIVYTYFWGGMGRQPENLCWYSIAHKRNVLKDQENLKNAFLNILKGWVSRSLGNVNAFNTPYDH